MRRAIILAALAGGISAAVVACTLNPQPLPPSDFSSDNDSDASTSTDGGFGGMTPEPSADAATGGDGGRLDDTDGGDAGDGGDGGDASDDGG